MGTKNRNSLVSAFVSQPLHGVGGRDACTPTDKTDISSTTSANELFWPYSFAQRYLEEVKRYSAEQNAANAARRAEREKPLHVKIQEWWDSLPESERNRPYTMDEFVCQFKTAPGLIGNALHRLGWRRGRKWGKGGYGRYWVRSD